MDLISLWRILQVVLGIGLVIFVHEFGHYIAARMCKVRVVVFSIGMGPRLFGWKRGDTQYQVAAVPLGGYVRMAGEETHYSTEPSAPDELGSKTVGQRFFIYSAGVIMNVIFGLVVFPLLLLVGIPSLVPEVGQVAEGSPAWSAGLEPGMRVLEVNGEPIYDLSQVYPEVAHGGAGPAELKVLREDTGEEFTLLVDPDYDERMGIYSIGDLMPAFQEGLPLTVDPESPAAAAGLQDGDQLLGVEGTPAGLSPTEQLYFAIRHRDPIDLRVQRGEEELLFEDVAPREIEGTAPRIGITALCQRLKAVMDTPLVAATGLQADDRILSVDGFPIENTRDVYDGLSRSEGPITWRLLRGDALVDVDSPELSPEERIDLGRQLAVVHDMQSTRVRVVEDSPAYQAGLRTGDEILKIDNVETGEFADLVTASAEAGARGQSMELQVRRAGTAGEDIQYLTLDITPVPSSQHSFGLALSLARYDYKVTNPFLAIKHGAVASFKMIRDVFRFLRGMMRREVGKQHVGSIIKISVIAHDTAEAGWVRFFWFLCLLSMNLAFLNVLPIPILDGGHLFFLLIEKIKGSPVSETLFSYSQLVGLVLIVSIFVFAIYNDLTTYVF